jgi:hypothetical protein
MFVLERRTSMAAEKLPRGGIRRASVNLSRTPAAIQAFARPLVSATHDRRKPAGTTRNWTLWRGRRFAPNRRSRRPACINRGSFLRLRRSSPNVYVVREAADRMQASRLLLPLVLTDRRSRLQAPTASFALGTDPSWNRRLDNFQVVLQLVGRKNEQRGGGTAPTSPRIWQCHPPLHAGVARLTMAGLQRNSVARKLLS